MRCVFDTNVFVSALLDTESKPRRALDLVVRSGKILLSFATIAELHEVLTRKWLRQYVPEEIVRGFLAGLTLDAELVDVETRIVACRDPKDNKFLELAVSGRAACIVTGDSDLLVLNPFRGIQIVSPSLFLESALYSDS